MTFPAFSNQCLHLTKSKTDLRVGFLDPKLVLTFRILYGLCASHSDKAREIIVHKTIQGTFNLQMISFPMNGDL